jgi:hypothetical protein
MESKIILTFDKKDLYEMFTNRVKKIASELSRAKYMDLPLKPCLDFYNTYQESERDGVDYIFDLEDKDDVAVLLSNCEDMKEFREFINSGKRFCFGGVYYPSPRFVNADDIFDCIRDNAFDLAAWMICFPQCCPKFITHKYLKPYNDLYYLIFPKCNMWDWWYQENNLGSIIRDNGEIIKIEL